MLIMTDISKTIQNLIDTNNVVLFMKGSSTFPQCGFSAKVVGILKHLEVEFKDIDVLESNEMRQGIKDFSNWPTIPQLYVKGQFIGGCDIVTEMMQNGELQKLFAEVI
jgi:monothiol glutaredoxin